VEKYTFNRVKENLEGLGYSVRVFASAREAADYLKGEIDGVSVGIGGSVTAKEMGLESLGEHNELHWHWLPAEGKTAADELLAAQGTEVYISSVNAIAESGEIVNIDGTGNRLASTLYGHKRVYFIIGRNKITPDLESAVSRARNVAAPLNAKRLGKKTPCAISGEKCYNCKSPERICRALSVFWQMPTGAKYEVLLIDEHLGY